jgi:hypothetical protein
MRKLALSIVPVLSVGVLLVAGSATTGRAKSGCSKASLHGSYGSRRREAANSLRDQGN